MARVAEVRYRSSGDGTEYDVVYKSVGRALSAVTRSTKDIPLSVIDYKNVRVGTVVPLSRTVEWKVL